MSGDEDDYICTSRNQYGSSLVKFQLRVISLKSYFLQRSFLYGSILLGLACCLILVVFALLNHWREKSDHRMRKRSSTTDETISSLAKQHDQIQHDEQDETNSNLDQYLFHEQFRIHHRQVRCDLRATTSQRDDVCFRSSVSRLKTSSSIITNDFPLWFSANQTRKKIFSGTELVFIAFCTWFLNRTDVDVSRFIAKKRSQSIVIVQYIH